MQGGAFSGQRGGGGGAGVVDMLGADGYDKRYMDIAEAPSPYKRVGGGTQPVGIHTLSCAAVVLPV